MAAAEKTPNSDNNGAGLSQLHHIVGAILRDIVQARVTSDIYSRDISKYYEKDSLLRLFPIPRSEIREVNIDLKFAIKNVEVDEHRKEDREARSEGAIEQYSESIALMVLEQFRKNVDTPLRDALNVTADDLTNWRKALQNSFNRYLIRNVDSLIDETALKTSPTKSNGSQESQSSETSIFDIKEAQRELTTILSDNSTTQDHLSQLSNAIQNSILSGIDQQMGPLLKKMDAELTKIYRSSQEYKIETAVTTDQLTALPPESISSIKITTGLRNYVWSQVEESEEEPVRRLILE